MREMFKVLPPTEALEALLSLVPSAPREETILTSESLGRVLVENLVAQAPLPAFSRSSMDGYAVRASDTFGASESLPAYLKVSGEVLMGRQPLLEVGSGEAAVIHTGGMVPPGADSVVMKEQTQELDSSNIEVLHAVAPGENLIQIGEDVQSGEPLLDAGHLMRPQDIGGLMALGITKVTVAARPRVAIVSTGDELVTPEATPGSGQVRDINTYTIAGIISEAGAIPVPGGIVRDEYESLLAAARDALGDADALVISAGSSVSTRDLTAEVVNQLGSPGVVVHGLALKPGKPTILGVCSGKPVLGLPGNPVSAMVVAGVLLTPLLRHMQGISDSPPPRSVTARLMRNVASAPGREDYLPVRLIDRDGEVWAQPVFGKSNLIYTLVKAHGKIQVPLNSNGLHEGEWVTVELM